VRDSADQQERGTLRIADAQRALVNAQIGDPLRVAEAQRSVVTAQEGVANAYLKTKEAALALAGAQARTKNSGLGVESARLGLERAELNQQRAYGASPGDLKGQEQELAREEADLAVKQARANLEGQHREQEAAPIAEQRAKQGLVDAQRNETTDAPLALQKAELARAAALREKRLRLTRLAPPPLHCPKRSMRKLTRY
jgi:hypothetical protein